MTSLLNTKNNPAVYLEGMNYTYGRKESCNQVLFDNQLTLQPGEIVCITGPSGSGKTTLLTLMGALRSVQEGSVNVLGAELRGLKKRDQVNIRQKIGFIFQSHNLFSSLTARQNIYMALELKKHTTKTKRAKAEKILTRLGLGERMDYKPQKLSEGQRQRIAIGRALVNEPKLILADEPTASLDQDSSQIVIDLLKDIAHEKNTTVFIVSHDQRAIDAGDRVVKMVDGKITKCFSFACCACMRHEFATRTSLYRFAMVMGPDAGRHL
ncbi:MAG: ATP-binding cassette domain-containing protein [Kiritimatiellae bacterium]|nr:ATP-binding cassette domain-containing protein [Kiritimatiellia bacterium]